MNKQQAIDLVKETFESPFEKGRFIKFVRNLLNKFDDEDARINLGSRIPESFRDYVEKIERIGKYTTEDKQIMLFIVHLKKETFIERARTMQRNLIAWYLTYGNESKDAALVAFVSPDGKDWRFSLVKLDVRLEATTKGRLKPVDEFTPARRWSFLVGVHEKSHTAQRQFQPILEDEKNNPTLARLEEAFNIEKVTKEFFEKYRNLFIRAKDELDKAVAASPKTKIDFESKGVDTVNLAKKLMGQIIFLYYLQKKGWFGVPLDAKWGEGSKNFLRELFEKKHGDYKNFFNDVLEHLFYDALRDDRSYNEYYYSRFDCRIPFLNGGLFDPMGGYDWLHTDILLPNELFSNNNKTEEGDTGDGILDVFDRYNFTVKEDEPFEKEVAIDPELLGKAYEKFNAIRPDNYGEYIKALKTGKKGEESKFNKQYGVYYTPREIVHYMCQQSLINYLYSSVTASEAKQSPFHEEIALAPSSSHNDLLPTKEDIALLIQQGENLREHEAQAALKETKTYTPKLPDSIRQNARLIDEKLAEIKVCDPAVGSGAFPVGMMSEIVRAREVLKTWTKTKKTVYDFKRECIENSLYGVDIDAGAVEIAKLRLWLSLIVDEDDIQNIKPLPNLDYKIMPGNSLLGLPDGILLDSEIKAELEDKKKKYFYSTNPNVKLKMREEISDLFSRLVKSAKLYAPNLSDINFDFHTHFSEAFHEKDGFDVVIGNPPYIGEKYHKDIFDPIHNGKLKKYYQGQMDLFYFFFHLSLDIAKQGANIAFITTNYYPTATGAKKLRRDIHDRANVKNLINFNELKIFESALGQHNLITILSKYNNETAIAKTVSTKRNGSGTSDILLKILQGSDSETDYYELPQNELYDGSEYYIRLSGNSSNINNPVISALTKIKNQGVLLSIICNVNVGLYTGADKVSNNYIEKYSLKMKKNEGIFIVTKDELEALKFNAVELSKVVPFYKNSDVYRWHTQENPQLFLINISYPENKDIDFKKLPNIFTHIAKYEKILRNRKSNDNGLRAVIAAGYWWSFTIRQIDFRKPKIVVPQRSQENTFGYNEIPWYASADVYFITEKDKAVSLKYLLAILNSKLYYLWLYHRGKRKGESLELYQQPLSEIPIKKITEDEQKPFIKLADRILAAKRANPQADTSNWEDEIDQLVYQLYGLTEEEINIVEGKRF